MTNVVYRPAEHLLVECAQKIERKPDASGIRVRNYEVDDVIPQKANNTSKVVKLRLEYVDGLHFRTVSLMLKIPFAKTPGQYEVGKSFGFYDKEADLYANVMPRIHELAGGEISPALYAVDDRQVLFMEDLSARGYQLRLDGQLDAEHCAVALRQLARLHAATHVLDRRDPHAVSETVRRQLFVSGDFLRMLFDDSKPFMDAVFGDRGTPTATVQKFYAAVDCAALDVAASIRSDRFRFNVLNHGDFKVHNILFSYDGETRRPVDCRLIDYQACRWSSPASDVIMLVVMSMDYTAYRRCYDRMLDAYALALNETLKALGVDGDVYAKADLERDLGSMNAYKLLVFMFGTAINIREIVDFLDYSRREVATDERVEKVRANREFQEKFFFWLDEFERTGVF